MHIRKRYTVADRFYLKTESGILGQLCLHTLEGCAPVSSSEDSKSVLLAAFIFRDMYPHNSMVYRIPRWVCAELSTVSNNLEDRS